MRANSYSAGWAKGAGTSPVGAPVTGTMARLVVRGSVAATAEGTVSEADFLLRAPRLRLGLASALASGSGGRSSTAAVACPAFLRRCPPRLPRLRLGLASASASGSGGRSSTATIAYSAFLWRRPPRLPRLRLGLASAPLSVVVRVMGEGSTAFRRLRGEAAGCGDSTDGAGRGGRTGWGRRRTLRLGATAAPGERLSVFLAARAIHRHCRASDDYAL